MEEKKEPVLARIDKAAREILDDQPDGICVCGARTPLYAVPHQVHPDRLEPHDRYNANLFWG